MNLMILFESLLIYFSYTICPNVCGHSFVIFTFSWFQVSLLAIKGNPNATKCHSILDNTLSTLCQQFGEGHVWFQHVNTTVQKIKLIN